MDITASLMPQHHTPTDFASITAIAAAYRLVPGRPRVEDVLPSARADGADIFATGRDLHPAGFDLLRETAPHRHQHRVRHRGRHACLRDSVDVVHQSGISIAADRDTGALRRLRGTPTTALSYFIGKILLVAIVSLAEAILLLSVGLLFFKLRLPATVFGWFTLTWVFLLGIVSCSLLGIFISNLASNAVSAAVITNGPAVGLQFVSGTYVPLIVLPTWMLTLGSIFPVKWMAQGFRSVLLPSKMVAFEPAGSWEHWHIFLVLTAWSIGGLAACLRFSDGRTRADRGGKLTRRPLPTSFLLVGAMASPSSAK